MNKIIEFLTRHYGEEVRLNEPAKSIPKMIPQELAEILIESNGIKEVIKIPDKGLDVEVGWIIYPWEMIIEETEMYRSQYNIDGVVFSNDGAGNPYYMKSNGNIYKYECIYGEEILMASLLLHFLLPNYK